MNTLLEGTGNGVNAGRVVVFFNGSQGEVERCLSDQGVLLAHGIDRQRQEVQQLRVTKGAQARRPGL
jgi:hypothetical protein